MILELDNVELYYKSKPVLNSIYLKACSGELTHILGRNGSGKSSLLRILFGDLKPKYKLIRIDGQPVTTPLFKSGTIKCLPELPFVPPNFRLKTVCNSYQVSWDGFKSHFADFLPTRNEKFKNLSTGEQRIFETYLILRSPGKIILLDEPFKSLSPLAIDKLKIIIREEKQKKIIIGADHHFDHWKDLSDRNYLLKDRSLKLLT